MPSAIRLSRWRRGAGGGRLVVAGGNRLSGGGGGGGGGGPESPAERGRGGRAELQDEPGDLPPGAPLPADAGEAVLGRGAALFRGGAPLPGHAQPPRGQAGRRT